MQFISGVYHSIKPQFKYHFNRIVQYHIYARPFNNVNTMSAFQILFQPSAFKYMNRPAFKYMNSERLNTTTTFKLI